MYDLKIDQGATEELLINDTEAARAVILVSLNEESAPIIEKGANFVDGKAQITLLYEDTNIPVGQYVYQIRLFDEDDEYFNLDNKNCSTGDCSFSNLTICPSLAESGS